MPYPVVYLFGMPRVERDGCPVAVERRKTLAMLACLAVTRQAHGRDALAALLWPELDAERGPGRAGRWWTSTRCWAKAGWRPKGIRSACGL